MYFQLARLHPPYAHYKVLLHYKTHSPADSYTRNTSNLLNHHHLCDRQKRYTESSAPLIAHLFVGPELWIECGGGPRPLITVLIRPMWQFTSSCRHPPPPRNSSQARFPRRRNIFFFFFSATIVQLAVVPFGKPEWGSFTVLYQTCRWFPVGFGNSHLMGRLYNDLGVFYGSLKGEDKE